MAIPPKYDLTKLLTPEFMAKPAWYDMASAMSEVLYEEFEKTRLAEVEARDPFVLNRDFKIMMSKMLGLDYRSAVLTDSDYNRLCTFLGTYNPEKGTKEFIQFLGFIKNAKLDLIPLWTKDYRDFTPGLPIGEKRIFDSPPGAWYPTTHVGIAYDQFITQTMDEVELERIFYEMAPINLVLKWVAAVITIILPTLYIGINFLSEEHIVIRAFEQYIAVLYLACTYVSEEHIVTSNSAEGYLISIPLETESHLTRDSSEDLFYTEPSVYWNMDASIGLPDSWTYSRSTEASQWNADGTLTWLPINIPRLNSYNPSNGTLLGWRIEPASINYVRWSQTPAVSPWTQINVSLTTNFNLGPDGNTTTRITDSSNTQLGMLRQIILVNQTGIYSFSAILRQVSSRYCCVMGRFLGGTLIEAGLVVDLQTGACVPINPGNLDHYGVTNLGNGWFRPRMSINGGLNTTIEWRIYPAWAASLTTTSAVATTGAIEYWHSQVEFAKRATSAIRSTQNPGNRAGSIIDVPPALSYFNQGNGLVMVKTLDLFPELSDQVIIHGYRDSFNQVQFGYVTGGFINVSLNKDTFDLSITSNVAFSSNTINKQLYYWDDPNAVKLYQNGAQVGANFFIVPTNLTSARIGSRVNSGALSFNGYLQTILMVSGEFTNQQLEDLTS